MLLICNTPFCIGRLNKLISKWIEVHTFWMTNPNNNGLYINWLKKTMAGCVQQRP